MDKNKKDLSFIDDVKELAAMPQIALDLLALLNDTATPVHDVVEKLKLDQGMVSFIFKCCNSPLFGIHKTINSIQLAVNLLGYMNIKSILMSYFTRSLYVISGKNYLVNFLWKHSVAVAVYSKQLSNVLTFKDEETYIAGLLHDIGKLVLYLHNPKKYEEVYQRFESEHKDFLQSEDDILGINHVEAGYYLMEKWGFSDFLKRSVLYHHEFESFLGLEREMGLIPFANLMVHNSFDNTEYNLDLFCKLYGLSKERLVDIDAEAMQLTRDYIV